MTTRSPSQQLMSATQLFADREAGHWPLARGEARRLDIGPGPRFLHVSDGQVWLTTAGEGEQMGEDRWLVAGESTWLADGSEVVLEARGEARFQLLVPPDACRRQTARHLPAWAAALRHRLGGFMARQRLERSTAAYLAA